MTTDKADNEAARARQAQAIAKWAGVLFDPAQRVEIRGLFADGPAVSCHFLGGQVAEMAARAIELEMRGAKGVYFTLNPLSPEPAAQGRAAKDADVASRRWFLFDADPVRLPKDQPSSDAERQDAWDTIGRVWGCLEANGVKGMLLGDSGNGFHILAPVDLPNDEASKALCKRILAEIGARLGTATVELDPKNFNASRICKLYGTRTRKGPATKERPHRWSRLIDHGGPLAWHQETAQANVAAFSAMVSRWDRADAMRKGSKQQTSKQAELARVRAYLKKVPGAVSGQNGHGATYHVACLLVHGFALSPEQALGPFMDWNTTCVPPWPESHLRYKLAEAEKATNHEKPRGHLRDKERANQQTATGSTTGGSTPPGTPPNEEEPEAEEQLPEAIEGVARLADLERAGAETKWAWRGWIACGVITCIAAEAGVGKTRFIMDLMRRVSHGLPWPDGTPMTLASDSRWLCMLADDNHAEVAEMVRGWGMEEVFYLPAPCADPFAGTQLDGHMDRLKHYMRLVKPTFLVIDTLGSATALKMHSQEEAEMLMRPLRKLAIACQCCILCLTHLNASGGVLGRRIVEKCRQVIKVNEPDREGQPNRRRLWVDKSNAKKPPHLGITMHDNGCDYDDQPPTAPDDGPGSSSRGVGRPTTGRLLEACNWLRDYLKGGRKAVSIARADAEEAGFNSALLYRARDTLGVEETKASGRLWWELECAEEEREF